MVGPDLIREANAAGEELVEAAREAADYLEQLAWRRRKKTAINGGGAYSFRMYAKPERILRRLRSALRGVNEDL